MFVRSVRIFSEFFETILGCKVAYFEKCLFKIFVSVCCYDVYPESSSALVCILNFLCFEDRRVSLESLCGLRPIEEAFFVKFFK